MTWTPSIPAAPPFSSTRFSATRIFSRATTCSIRRLPWPPAQGFVLFRKIALISQPRLRFVFLGSGICLRLPSDSVSQRTPLPLANGWCYQPPFGTFTLELSPMPGGLPLITLALARKDFSIRVHASPGCGLTVGRDVSAARNVLAIALKQDPDGAFGDGFALAGQDEPGSCGIYSGGSLLACTRPRANSLSQARGSPPAPRQCHCKRDRSYPNSASNFWKCSNCFLTRAAPPA